jgi:hypothetical protein
MPHTNLTCAIFPQEVRNYLHEDFLHKALPLQEPADQLLKPRTGAIVIPTLTTNSAQLILNAQTRCNSEDYCLLCDATAAGKSY